MAEPFEAGSFFLGCNYWASHAGTNMWRVWDEAVVRSDLERLRRLELRYLRVFPLWSDFQPLRMHRMFAGQPREVRLEEAPLPFTEAGQAGVSEEMVRRFERFMDIAGEYGMRLVIGLITGWMSGRQHLPEMLQGCNPLTDPLAIRWEVRYMRYMTRVFRKHPALLAWDLGNECNCMGKLQSADELYVWMACISQTIRTEDPDHPIISGMHGLRPMTIMEPRDQGELLDLVCTHPYPLFTPHCDTDPISSMKSTLHAVAESRMSADLSKKPCFVEEIGTLGSMIVSEEGAADYLRSVLLSLWRYDCRGLMWWCAFDQGKLTHTPYEWNAVERELGLFEGEREKPIAGVLQQFSKFYQCSPIQVLPPYLTDAICIMTRGQDVWAAAYGIFILGCQAKLDFRYVWCEDELPESPVYILPSLSSDQSISARQMRELLARVECGATLCLSMDNALLSSFESFTGMRVISREKRTGSTNVSYQSEAFSLSIDTFLNLHSVGAEVLAETDEGLPFMSRYTYGSGQVYLINAPIERIAATYPGITDGGRRQQLYKFYRSLNLRSKKRSCDCSDPLVGLTEHPLDAQSRIIMVQNYALVDREIILNVEKGCKVLNCVSPDDRMRQMQACPEEIRLFIPHHSGGMLYLSFDSN